MSLHLKTVLLFAKAAMTKYHRRETLGGSNNQMYCLTVLETRSVKSRCGQAMLSLKPVEESFLASFWLLMVCSQSFVPWLTTA